LDNIRAGNHKIAEFDPINLTEKCKPDIEQFSSPKVAPLNPPIPEIQKQDPQPVKTHKHK
jgi:hypothetical protein